MKTGGNLPNANSIVMRLDYGDFSMLLTGRCRRTNRTSHAYQRSESRSHGSQGRTSRFEVCDVAGFLDRVKPEVAIISCGEWNRYGHPSQVVLDRLRAANVKLYRTDLQGEITITTRGKENDYVIKTAKEATDGCVARTHGPER